MIIPVVIPAYEPDERFVALIQNLIKKQITPIVIVDDGSAKQYQKFFNEAAKIMKDNGIILKHNENRGKGAALKTAFKYILKTYPSALGCVTADCDGQHSPECVEKIRQSFSAHQGSLLLGVREFDQKDIPFKSKFGNSLTRFICKFFAGLNVNDTQTGLRGVPLCLMPALTELKGNRFEYEMQMLIYCADKVPIVEVPIKTIYESKKNHQTHFNPLADSVKIYGVIFKQFYKYIVSSVLSFLLDISAFWCLCRILKNMDLGIRIVSATVLARIISAAFNILMNYVFVFESRKNFIFSSGKYVVLAICIMLLSALFVSKIAVLIPMFSPVLIKVCVDCLLFVLSFYMQKKYVF